MKKQITLTLSILFLMAMPVISKAQTAEALSKSGLEKVVGNDREGAIVDYTKSIALKANPDTYYKRGIAYMLTKNYTKALEDFNKAEESKKTDAKFFFMRADCKSKMKDNKEAVADFDKAIALRADYGKAYFFRGRCKLSLKDKDAACMDFQKAIDLKYDKALETMKKECAK